MRVILLSCVLGVAACARPCADRCCPPIGRAPCNVRPAVAKPTADLLPSEAAPDPAFGAWTLRQLPKEQRWARARQHVGLTPAQEQRLREAVVERDQALGGKTSIVTRLAEGLPLGTAMGDDDEWTILVDSEALRAADAAFDARTTAILDAGQMSRWRAGGYDKVFGVRLPILPPSGAPPYRLDLVE